jgi:hypothetical protein
MKQTEYPPAVATTDESEIINPVQNGVTKSMTLAQANAMRQLAAARLSELVALVGAGYISIAADGTLEVSDVPGAGVFDPIGTADAAVQAHDASSTAHGSVEMAFGAHEGAGGDAHSLATSTAKGFCPIISTQRRDSLRGDLTFSDEIFFLPTFKTVGTHALQGENHVVANATGGAVGLNLPVITPVNNGKEFLLSRFDAVVANAVTIAPSGTQTIAGLASYALAAQYQSIRLNAVFIDAATSYWAIS